MGHMLSRPSQDFQAVMLGNKKIGQEDGVIYLSSIISKDAREKSKKKLLRHKTFKA